VLTFVGVTPNRRWVLGTGQNSIYRSPLHLLLRSILVLFSFGALTLKAEEPAQALGIVYATPAQLAELKPNERKGGSPNKGPICRHLPFTLMNNPA
jgi:hypothetical protein